MPQFKALVELVRKKGVELQIDTSKSLAESLDKAEMRDDPYFNQLVRILSTRCMTPALYFSSGSVPLSEFYHYGLAVPIYTHFTSPIRRYAGKYLISVYLHAFLFIDVIVHRLLAASIGAAPLPAQLTHRNVQDICSQINRRHRMADVAGMDSTRLHTLIFFKNRSVVESARVIGVKANGFLVLVPRFVLHPGTCLFILFRYGIEGKVYLPLKELSAYTYDKHVQSLMHKNKGIVTVFDSVKVHISLDEEHKQAPKIKFLCISPPIHTAPPPSAHGDDGKAAEKTKKRLAKAQLLRSENKRARKD